jgi:dTDP-4-amino-4,6-dideoxygalactose transaminase
MINLFQPNLGDDELKAISQVFKSNWLGKGDFVNEFEERFALNLNSSPSKFLSTTSCTEGIFLAAELFDFNSADQIIIPTISFPSVASSVVAKGAQVVFCDVDKITLNVTAKNIKKVITESTKAVFITHYGGVPCDMDPIIKLCNENNILIIEDSACAVKSFYKGKACGTIGDMGIWSFDAMKTLSTADGGMMYIKNDKLRIKAKELLYLGLPHKQKSGLDSSTLSNNSWWEFEMNYPGRRAIMNNLTASIGCVQLKKLNGFLSRRKEIHEMYFNSLKHLEWITLPPKMGKDYISSYYFFTIQTKHRTELANYLLANDVYSTFRYWPLNKIKLFKQYVNDDFPDSEYASSHSLNIPLHQSLSNGDVKKIIALIKNFKSSQ